MKKKSNGFLGKLLGTLNKATSEVRERTEAELPFAVMIFTLMAASGISPYDSWKKMRKLSFLPIFKKEADEVVRQVIRHRFLDPGASAQVIGQKLRQAGQPISTRSVERVLAAYGLQKKTL